MITNKYTAAFCTKKSGMSKVCMSLYRKHITFGLEFYIMYQPPLCLNTVYDLMGNILI